MASSLTKEIAALRVGVRRVVLVLAQVSAVTVRRGSVSKIEKAAALKAIEGMTKRAKGSFDMKRDFDAARALAFRIREAREAKKAAGLKLVQEATNRQNAWTLRNAPRSPTSTSARRWLAERMLKPVAVRLDELRVSTVTKAAKATLRHGAPGGTSFGISFVEPGQPADYTIETRKNWDTYGRRCVYPALEDHHRITVERGWLSTVRKIGGPTIKGCLILAAKAEVMSEDGERSIWKATIARQGVGYSAVVEERWIGCWGHGIATLHRSFGVALRENPPEAILSIVRQEAADRELANLSAEDLEALRDIAA